VTTSPDVPDPSDPSDTPDTPDVPDPSDSSDTSDTPDSDDSAASPGPVSTNRVATGILVAERTAGAMIARRRRWLVGGGVLGLLLLLSTVGGRTLLQSQANSEAVESAERGQARAALASAVIEIAEAYELPAVMIETDAQRLRQSLEAHLAVGAREAVVVNRRREAALRSLRDSNEALQAEANVPAPVPDDLVSGTASGAVLTELATLRAEAGALGVEVEAAAVAAELWSEAVRDVQERLLAYVTVVEEQPATTDPDELITQWRSEREPLRQLGAAARRAAQVPGLQGWAQAHLDYATNASAWVAQAVVLLEAVNVDSYNDSFAAVFGVEDPFGFVAAATAGAQDALTSPALVDLATVQARAQLVLQAVTTIEQAVVRELSTDQSPTEDPTEAPTEEPSGLG
jgi:hypothetical protein